MTERRTFTFLDRFFGYTKAGSSFRTEIVAGLTTFFAMSYIIIVNPSFLSDAGIEWGAGFLATIIAAVIGTLFMALIANVPYAQAPAMGINAFFTYTVCFGLGFTWQQALSMVFLCGLINIIITITNLRKAILKSIPLSLQYAISGGIGIFVAYIGLLNVGIINVTGGVPALSTLNTPALWVFLIGMVLVVVLYLLKFKAAMLIAILITTLIGIPFGVTTAQDTVSFAEACAALPTTFCAIFTDAGIVSLFTDVSKIPLVLITIFAFSITDTFDTIGTFVATGRRTGLLNEKNELTPRLEKALFADAAATSVGAIFGTSNTTTFVESAAGVEAGGKTGLTSVVVAICFALSAFLAALVSAVPYAATAPVLVMVGIMMCSSFKRINWEDMAEAVPAFFAGIFMSLCYSISYGIAAGFIFYCVVMIVRGKAKAIHPIIWGCTALFILNFVFMALL